MCGIPSLAHQHQTNGDKWHTLSQPFETLSKGHDHMVGESNEIVNNCIQPRTTYSLHDSDTWSITKEHTIGRSVSHAEVSHYHGLGEQYNK